tara:strand:- start:944 stop:2164 length:1221 start_codon:yes stop_codon:yes gene_type:complete
MKNSKELKEMRSDIIGKLEEIKLIAENEERDLTTEENTSVDGLLTDADNMDAKILRAEKMEKEIRLAASTVGTTVAKPEVKEVREWSLFKAVNEMRNGGTLTGLEAEMHKEAEKENRGALNGIGMPSFMTEKRDIDQTGSAIAPSVTGAYAEALVQGGVYSQVGLNDLGNMAADTIIPITGASTASWAAENGAVTNSGVDFGKVTLTPNRLSAVVNLSNVIVAQNVGAEAAIMAQLGQQVSSQIDAAMFGSTDVTNAPGSIAGTTGVLTFTEAVAADLSGDALTAIQTIADDHGLGGNNAFVYNWAAYKGLMTDAQVANVSAAMASDLLLGRPVYFSDAPATVAATSADGLFGDFDRVYMASFGPTTITVDPYTRAANNEVRLTLNNHYGWGVANGASFVKFTSVI